jgi:hypothetical protein
MTPEEYRRLAEECDHVAGATTDLITKRTYEQLAQQWRALADDVERYGLARATFEY